MILEENGAGWLRVTIRALQWETRGGGELGMCGVNCMVLVTFGHDEVSRLKCKPHTLTCLTDHTGPSSTFVTTSRAGPDRGAT